MLKMKLNVRLHIVMWHVRTKAEVARLEQSSGEKNVVHESNRALITNMETAEVSPC